MDEVVVSAPGKVILHGEHAVVYGKSALASSLSLQTYLHLKRIPGDKISLNLPNLGVFKSWNVGDLTVCKQKIADLPEQQTGEIIQCLNTLPGVDTDTTDNKELATTVFLHLYLILSKDSKSLPSVKVNVNSELPVGAGLGSSASFCTCLASSLLLLFGHISEANTLTGQWSSSDLDIINKWAFEGEKIIHGKPSGVDNSVATFGGMLTFKRGKIDIIKKVPELEILLINTKIPRSTKKLVEKVREKYNKYTDIMQPVIESIEAITLKCQVTCTELSEKPDNTTELYHILEDLIDINQGHLSVLGVSHPAIDQICNLCSKKSLHAKLTGAGGGGCVLCLINPEIPKSVVSELKKELNDLGFGCLETSIGCVGLSRHLQLPEKFIKQDLVNS